MSYAQHVHEAEPIVARCGVITLSDSRGREQDVSGNMIRDMLAAAGHSVSTSHWIADDPAVLQPLLGELLGRADIDVVLSTGGTGVARRDVTIDVVERAIIRRLEGFGELFRMLSYEQVGSGAMLSRALGGVAGERADKLLFAMPGSPKAVELAMTKLIVPELKHLLREMRK